ncbi:MAG: hypothetical protein DMF56_12295 [Acidobacteria bacterium]|nr:MAG: hypothetical protein DMF56_12295 [Acidobacteriota bacterium]
MRKAFTYALATSMALLIATCGGSPTDPTSNPINTLGGDIPTLAAGRWSGENVCLSVEGADVQLQSGCWRGHFAKPTVQSNGTFSIDGTYRFEAGPTTNEGPNAHYSGKIVGNALTLTVQPTGGSPVTYDVTLAGSGSCPSLCV